MKKCPCCKISKDELCFYKNNAKKDGRCCYCKSCTNEKNRLYDIKNRDAVLANQRKYMKKSYAANPSKFLKRTAHWERNNPNPERIKRKVKKLREYCQKIGPEKLKIINQKKDARHRMEMPNWWVAKVLRAQGINPNPELIELKRLQLQGIRLIKKITSKNK